MFFEPGLDNFSSISSPSLGDGDRPSTDVGEHDAEAL